MIRFTVPLFWKFVAAIIIIVAIFGSINVWLISKNVNDALERELEKRGLFIARNLAERAIDPLLYEDFVLLQKLVEDTKQLEPSIMYAFILDGEGNVIVHTFPTNVPAALIKSNVITESKNESVQLLTPKDSTDHLIRDIAIPVISGKVGTVRIGLIEENIQADVKSTIKTLLLMVGVFLAMGIIGAFFYAYFITKPIETISGVADKLDLDSLKYRTHPKIRIREKLFGLWKIPVRAEDELDLLANKFNTMVERLERTYSELQTAQSTIIQSEKMASIGILTSGIAHEINNPIAGLQNCIRRIAKNPENIEQNKKYLKMMEGAADRIERVVQGLLNFTRKHDLQFRNVQCNEIVEKALILVGYRLEKARIGIIKNIPDDLPPITGSQNHLEQVLINLILNSIDAINERKLVEPDCPARIEFHGVVENSSLVLSIGDTGIGISPEVIPKIFDPFYTTKETGKGTGLGLSVSYNIIKEHGGEIEVSSVLNKGTNFTIHLPLNNKN